jgi:hypothetical protein
MDGMQPLDPKQSLTPFNATADFNKAPTTFPLHDTKPQDVAPVKGVWHRNYIIVSNAIGPHWIEPDHRKYLCLRTAAAAMDRVSA